MGFSRVLLIQLNAADKFGGLRPPVGLGYLSEYLEAEEIETSFIDQFHNKSLRSMIAKAEKYNPDLIGFTLFSIRYRESYHLIGEIKKKFPNAGIAVGGPHVSTFREKVLDECREIDFGVVLEGEQTLYELCTKDDYSQIKGLIHRLNGKVVYNGDREFIRELDQLQFPKYKKFDLKKYIPEKFIISSRGCPYRCTFCPVHSAIGRKMRYRSPENIINEIIYWYEKGYRQFDFQDDNFTLLKKRVWQICDFIKKNNLKGLFLRCSNGIRADKVDYDLLKCMYDVGFRSVGLGVESGSNRVLKMMNKSTNIETIENAIQNASDIGYDIHLFFLVGMPGETEDDLEKSLQVALKYPILKVNFYNVIPYPGTELFDYIEKNDLFKINFQDYLNSSSSYSDEPLFVTPELKLEQRVKWLKKLHRVEKEIMRRGAERRMRKWGKLPAKIGSYLFVTDVTQKLIFNNNTVRKFADKLRYSYISSNN